MNKGTNDIAITTLQQAREILIKQKDEAMAEAAKPFIKKIANIESAIQQLKESPYYTNILGKSRNKPKRGRPFKETVIPDIYPTDGTILSKFQYILKEAQRLLTIQEVADRVRRYEPNENEILIKKKFGKHIDMFRAKGKIITVGKARAMRYGLPQWLDDKGFIKPEFELRKFASAATDLAIYNSLFDLANKVEQISKK